GRLHVFWGGSAWSATPGRDIESAGTGAEYVLFGRTLTVGDYNGDTWPDIAVGIDMAMVAGLNNAGRIDVYWGPDWGTRTEITSPDNGADNFFGSALASGDINGDQIDDLVEGSGRDDVGGITNLGSAHLFLGPTLQLFTTLVAPMPSGINTRFGDAVHVLHTDEPLGASVVVFDLKNHGFLYPPDSLSSPSVLWKPMADAQVPVSQTLFGALLADGDVNGDGRRDILISDCFEGDWSGCSPLGGGGRSYFSLAPYFASFLLLHDVVEECGAEFGWRSATGDLDGDGRIDVVVGARDSDAGGIQNSGHVVVFFSNGSG
ncbi:MAG TPA: FG-GAP repeat protein, partial [Planctomycetota bacterium]|nr:FG-GAP repeat protein [Planctomycetota bacterium]